MRSFLRARHVWATVLAVCLLATCSSVFAEDMPEVSFQEEPGKVQITIGGNPVALYVYEDAEISRPHFAHVHAPGGVQVSRNHPPIEGQDKMDHSTFHPGIWMAFGDLSGSDSWRLQAPVTHNAFIEKPSGGPGRGSFAVRNRYVDQQDNTKAVCEEECKFTISVVPAGYLLTWDSTFSSDHEFYFGDQEEMGLGIRVATPIRVEGADGPITPGNGTMIDSEGRKNGAEIGGNASDWCDYSGTLDGQHVGMTIFCHPDNFRPSWFHARDYGFMEANPFGRAAFDKGEPSKVVVKPGEKLRLRYGVLLHGGPAGSTVDLDDAYSDYVRESGE
jgi:hypothetical protein